MAATRLRDKILEHFSHTDYLIAAFIYRCTFITEDHHFTSILSGKVPENDVLYQIGMNVLFGEDRIAETAAVIEDLIALIGEANFNSNPIHTARMVIRMRSHDLVKACAQ